MPNPNDVPPARYTEFDINEIAALIGALASLAPHVHNVMPHWPQRYQDAVTKALEMTTVTAMDGVDLAYIWVGPLQIVFDLTDSDGEGS